MERKAYTRYSREFKLEAVRLAALEEKPKARIARELGIRVNQLRKWRLEFEQEERTGAPKQGPVVDDDLGRLRRENTRLKEENEILKKSGHLLRAEFGVKYQFIDTNRRSYAVKALCGALKVSTSGYYASRSRPRSARSERQTVLMSQIRAAHTASRDTYGAPRVHAELSAQGVACCRNTVAKLMRQAQIMPKAIRRFRVTTDSRNTKASPNLVDRVFAVSRPNACWLSDITFIPTREGWLYLAAILDLYSRAVVGWCMSKSLDSQLATDALTMAIERRGSGPAILHSDQGSTYATAAYRALLDRHAIRQSMSRKGDCWDNAPMESFFHTLKTELVMHCDYKTRDQARASLFEYMEVFYNRQRRHSTIQYTPPLDFEASTIA